MEVRISFNPYSGETTLSETITEIKNEDFLLKVHEAIEHLLEEPAIRQTIQENGGLHLVWDALVNR